MVSARAHRWATLAEYWARECGHEVHVICGWQSGLEEFEYYNGVQVHRVRGGWLARKVADIGSSDFARQSQHAKSDGTTRSPVARFNPLKLCMHIGGAFWRSIRWPDYACLWHWPATEVARQLMQKYQFKAIYTVSHPFSGHLVGLQLHDEFSDVPWIVDIGDPFCFLDQTPTNNQRLYKKLNYRVEGQIFDRASAISVTTSETRDEYVRLFPANRGKIQVIPPLVSPIYPPGQDASQPREKTMRRLVFCGALYRSIRNPRGLLKLFAELVARNEPWELHFVGATRDCEQEFEPYKNLLNQRIFIHGIMPREAAIQHMQNADALVNLGNSTAYQLPSKLVEYVMLKRPILNLVINPNDTSAAFLRSYPWAITIHEDNEGGCDDQVTNIKQFLTELPTLDDELWQTLIRPFTLPHIVKKYEELVLQKVGDSPTRAAAA
jgi:glycosyltransferase involved in cell wall biosynthesis